MRRRHAISPGFSGHYEDLGILSLEGHASAYATQDMPSVALVKCNISGIIAGILWDYFGSQMKTIDKI